MNVPDSVQAAFEAWLKLTEGEQRVLECLQYGANSLRKRSPEKRPVGRPKKTAMCNAISQSPLDGSMRRCLLIENHEGPHTPNAATAEGL